jgi:molybdopterin-guanine dinucleotide biosynthesis protein A
MHNFLKRATAVILAGGENKRMPVSKAFIKIGRETIVEKNLKIMKQLFNEVSIVTNQPGAYVNFGVPLLGDIYNIRCPMTGIFTSLVNSSHQWVFISACDMPFINSKLIRYMSLRRGNCEAVVPLFKGKMEPLMAFYSKQLAPIMERALFTDQRGLNTFLKDKNVNFIEAKNLNNIDNAGKSFINLNTPKDIYRELGKKYIIKQKPETGG